MPALKLSERLQIAALAIDRTGRSAASRVLRSRLLRWRYGPPIAEQFLILPQDIRTADPSFAREFDEGCLGLAGTVANLDRQSPFTFPPPSAAWARALHGFGWLRDLRVAPAASSAEARSRQLVLEWIARSPHAGSIAWETAVVARRLISWISHAALLLDTADEREYDRITASLGEQLIHLSASWHDAPAGLPRLVATTALVLADLCVSGHESQFAGVQAAFAAEIEVQILADGGHISRDPGALVELLLDLLPLRQCFAALGREAPPAMSEAIPRMTSMVRHLRLGDGTLARFNGTECRRGDEVATVLAYDDPIAMSASQVTVSGYVRMERAGTVIIADAGAPPPMALAGKAHAGCLSFEMSSQACAMLVNAGLPEPADQKLRAVARATASHNTLCINETSSSRLVGNAALARHIGGVPISEPRQVNASLAEAGGGSMLTAAHDGYLQRYKLLHRRQLTLDAAGRRLEGVDVLESPGGQRFAYDLRFAIHFHLHPGAACEPAAEDATVNIWLPDGQQWRLTAAGARVSIEDSQHVTHALGPQGAMQIVLRGACAGASEVQWSIERMADGLPIPAQPPYGVSNATRNGRLAALGDDAPATRE